MKCIKCYQEIDDGMKFCPHCGTMQPADREAYEKEHPELAMAISDEDLNKLIHDKSHERQMSGPQVPPATGGMSGGAGTGYIPQPPQPPQYPAATPPQYPAEAPQNPMAATANTYTTPAAEQVGTQSNETPNENMLQCPECGSLVDANSTYCLNCGCPFVISDNQSPDDGEPLPLQEDNDSLYYTELPSKNGMSGWAKGLIAFAVTLLLAAAGGAVYYFFFMNNVKRLNVDPEEVLFSRKGGVKKVTIDTDARDFEIAKSPKWAKVEITGDDEITITCQPLDDNESEREDIIRITAGDKREKIVIKQSAKATYLTVDGSYKRIRVEHNDGTIDIPIDTDGDPEQFDYQCLNDYGSTVDWIYVSDKSRSGITVTLDSNNSPSARAAVITITSGKLSETIMIKQNGECYLCDGTGRKECLFCNGTGKTNCSTCYGSGEEYVYGYDEDGNYVSGYTTCTDCNGSGRKSCDYCNGQGYNVCEYCNGTGEEE